MSKWDREKENLKILIEKGTPYEEIGRMFGCTGSNIKKVSKQIGLELPNRRKIADTEHFNRGTYKTAICLYCGREFRKYPGSTGKYCSTKCFSQNLSDSKYNKLLVGDPSVMRANYTPMRYKSRILEEQNGVCAICGMKPIWNGKDLTFILDHIDGHASNNKRDNLRCICPNCDSQLSTYKSKNKCGERSYYRYHKDKQE